MTVSSRVRNSHISLTQFLLLVVFLSFQALIEPRSSHADSFFSAEDLRVIASLLADGGCNVHCETDKWTIRCIPFPSNDYAATHPEESLYLVVDDKRPMWCGSAGCPATYLLKDQTRLIQLREGFGIDKSAPLAVSDIPSGSALDTLPGVPLPVSPRAAVSDAELARKIDAVLARLPKVSDYLYEMDSLSGQITGTWVELTSGLLGTKGQRVAYDEFYASAGEYAGLVAINVRRAERALKSGNAGLAQHLLETALRYEQQFYLADKAAIEAYNGNLDAAIVLAKGIYEGSKASAMYGADMALGPFGSGVVDRIFDLTDFAVIKSESGLSAATKDLVASTLTEMIFSHAQVGSLNGKTLEDAINSGTTKALGSAGLYEVVLEATSDPDFAKQYLSFVAKSGAYIAKDISGQQIEVVVKSLIDQIAEQTPSPTVCGSTWYQRLGLQFLEAEQATRSGYSFDAACKTHDQCYIDCMSTKEVCDTRLLDIAVATCEDNPNRVRCLVDAAAFHAAVTAFGGDAFAQARASCEKSAVDGADTNATISATGALEWFDDSLHVTSQDQRLVAFRRCSGNRSAPTCTVILSDSIGSNDATVIHASNHPNQFPIAFSSVGLLFSSPPDVYTYKLANGEISLVANDAWAPGLAPDGKKLAYVSSYVSGEANVYILDLQSKDLQRVTNFEGKSPGGQFIRWLSDGRTIVFELQDNKTYNMETWSVRTDGTQLTKVADGQVIDVD